MRLYASDNNAMKLKARTHYPCSRAVNTGNVNTAREHGYHFVHP